MDKNPRKTSKIRKKQGLLYNIYPLKVDQSIEINGAKIHLKSTSYLPIQNLGKKATIIVSDKEFNKLNDKISEKYIINGNGLRKSEKLYLDVKRLGVPFVSAYQTGKEVERYNSPALLMISFMAILLFISISCIMMFTTLIENMDTVVDFEMLSAIGYSKAALKKIAVRNILLLFMPPLVLGLLNGIMAFLAFRYILLSDSVVKILGIMNVDILPILLTILIFGVIYAIVFSISWNETKLVLLKNL